jgi:uncharacterized protein YdhG (YjbR/CyaY superfamily)
LSVIDDYFKGVDPEVRSELERVRTIVKRVVPDAEEAISYGMPAFRYRKKYLIAFAPFKDHMSVFPGASPITELQAELKSFKQSKGTIQFTKDHPLPESVIRALMEVRIKEIEDHFR